MARERLPAAGAGMDRQARGLVEDEDQPVAMQDARHYLFGSHPKSARADGGKRQAINCGRSAAHGGRDRETGLLSRGSSARRARSPRSRSARRRAASPTRRRPPPRPSPSPRPTPWPTCPPSSPAPTSSRSSPRARRRVRPRSRRSSTSSRPPPVRPRRSRSRSRPLAEPAPEPAPAAPAPAPKVSWWRRLHAGARAHILVDGLGRITSLFTKRKLDATTLEDLEDILIQADLGVPAATRITQAVAKGRYDKEIPPEEVKRILAEEVERSLAAVARPLRDRPLEDALRRSHGRRQRRGQDQPRSANKLAAKFPGPEALRHPGRGRHGYAAAAIEQAEDLGRAHEVPRRRPRKQGADAAGLAFERAHRRPGAKGVRRAPRRHRRAAAEPRRADVRAREDRARDEEGRPRGAHTPCCSVRRRHGGSEPRSSQVEAVPEGGRPSPGS